MSKPEGGYREKLVELVASLGRQSIVGAEVGVLSGRTSERLLRLPNVTLFMIDPWSERPAYDPYRSDPNGRHSQVEYDDLLRDARRNTQRFASRREIVQATSRQAADTLFDFTPLDFVFIDAVHLFDSVMEDSLLWWPKLREGGLMIWHDYANPSYPDVERAVDLFASNHGRVASFDVDLYLAWVKK